MNNSTINKVLIANRGEIALRIGRACKKLGLSTVQPLSEADAEASFAKAADISKVIGPAAARESYLNIDRLIELALDTGCDAVHPGYGFLSENAEFAEAVAKAGLIFVGPSPEAIRLLGDKTAARTLLAKNQVPLTRGAPAGLTDSELVRLAEEIGFPVILKAVAGGGGRGMRICRDAKEMRDFLPRVRSEAEKFFSNADVYFEQYIENPRHVEVQIFGDRHGNVLHFGTRECSLQRRHQKIVEEAPAAFVPTELLDSIQQAAVNAGRAVNYENAGTCEFLVKDGSYYFLEINTRIQVEHPATEQITGIDLVELQFKVAMGEPIGFKQKAVKFKGHAIEYRIYAEDPYNNFAPASGMIEAINLPPRDWLRDERGFTVGDKISLHYDALITKLIVWGQNRNEALARSRELFSTIEIAGLKSSIDFHRWVLMQPEFIMDKHDINYLDRSFNSAALNLVAASRAHDPEHQPGQEESADVNGKKLKIIHRPDGLFLAIGPNGRLLSNSRKALIDQQKQS